MNNRDLSLKDRVIVQLVTHPESLDMGQFSQLPSRRQALARGTTCCLAGIILLVSEIAVKYNSRGIAVGLADGEVPPSLQWVEYEMSISAKAVSPEHVIVAAKARELWADEHGNEAAKCLPFYGPDWFPTKLRDVKADDVIELVQCIGVAAGRLASLA